MQAVEAYAKADPYVQHGLVESWCASFCPILQEYSAKCQRLAESEILRPHTAYTTTVHCLLVSQPGGCQHYNLVQAELQLCLGQQLASYVRWVVHCFEVSNHSLCRHVEPLQLAFGDPHS